VFDLKKKIYELEEHLITHGPTFLFSNLRYRFYKKQLMPNSGPFSSMTGLFIPFPKSVFIGENVSINQYVLIDACCGGKIHIGDNCSIGPYVLIQASDHRFDDTTVPINKQGWNPGEIVIKDDCWIGGHVTITRNVTIGKGSVIGANSVVTNDIPDYSVAVGCPARVIRMRSSSIKNRTE
jgi:acetyltransferase-like isoleucine patch superfamily enzyme